MLVRAVECTLRYTAPGTFTEKTQVDSSVSQFRVAGKFVNITDPLMPTDGYLLRLEPSGGLLDFVVHAWDRRG